MPNPNKCETCDYKNVLADGKPVEGHCFMFFDEPSEVCMQHTMRTVGVIGSHKALSIAMMIAALQADRPFTSGGTTR